MINYRHQYHHHFPVLFSSYITFLLRIYMTIIFSLTAYNTVPIFASMIMCLLYVLSCKGSQFVSAVVCVHSLLYFPFSILHCYLNSLACTPLSCPMLHLWSKFSVKKQYAFLPPSHLFSSFFLFFLLCAVSSSLQRVPYRVRMSTNRLTFKTEV